MYHENEANQKRKYTRKKNLMDPEAQYRRLNE